MSTKYNPGATVTVGELEVGDTIFLREQIMAVGKPVPVNPVVVTQATPRTNGRVEVWVRAANSPASANTARTLGTLPATREFRAAVEEV